MFKGVSDWEIYFWGWVSGVMTAVILHSAVVYLKFITYNL